MNGGALAPLRHVGFRYVLGARFASLLGNAVAPIALAFAVLDLTGSPTALGLVLAARTVPHVLLMLYGGVIADRLPRQLVLATANGLCFLTQAVAATLLLTGTAEVWHLALIEALNGASAAFTLPAMAGLIPQVVPRADLQQANALSGLARHLTTIGGASAGGFVVALLGAGWGLAVDAATFAVAAVLLVRVRLPPVERSVRSSVVADLRDGWQEFVARRWVWLVVLAFTLLCILFAGCWQTLGPVVADETFGRRTWGVLLACHGLGMAIGALLLLRFRPRRPVLLGMFGMALEAPMLFVLGFDPEPVPLAVAAVVAGIGVAVFSVTWETALQHHIPPDRLSRVASYDMMGSFAAIPLGQLAAGPLAGVFGARKVIEIGAVIYAAVALLTAADRSVRRLRRSDAGVGTGVGG